MRPAIVIGFLGLALALRIAFGSPPEGSFDDRFRRADEKLEAMAKSIEADLEEQSPRP